MKTRESSSSTLSFGPPLHSKVSTIQRVPPTGSHNKLDPDVGSVIAMAPTAKITDDARSCGVPLMPYPRAMPIINSWAKRGIIIQALYQTFSLSLLFVGGR